MRKLDLWASDRNFNTEEPDESKFYYVAEHNDLITKARHDLTARQLKIMDFVISKIKPSDSTFNVVHTSMYEITNILGLTRSGKNYSDIINNINEMRKKDVFIYNEKERKMTITGWFSDIDVWENGQIELRINQNFAPYLLSLKENYTQYLLLDTIQLNSKYSILLYKLMREADKDYGKKKTVLSGTPDEFKEWLGAPKSYAFKDLNKNVLQKAIDEINLKINDMELEMFTAKRGRKIVQVDIRNHFIKQNKINDNNMSKLDQGVPMLNWLEGKK